MGFDPISLALIAGSVAMQVHSASQQAQSANRAARFNAKQARQAAAVQSDDARENALRRQEDHRKYIGDVRARMFSKGDTIEGGDAEFLGETVGNLQLQIMDESVAINRGQASLHNQAFRSDFDAKAAKASGKINTATAAISGFNSIASAGVTGELWGQPKKNPAASYKPPSAIA